MHSVRWKLEWEHADFVLHLKAGPPGGLPTATCLIYCERRGAREGMRECECVNGQAAGEISEPRAEDDSLMHAGK
jgi:hypothetical protein